MKFKLIVAMVSDDETDLVLETAREAGATGSTVITNGRGEGLKRAKTFFGLDLESQRDLILLLVEGHLSRTILEQIAEAGEFEKPGAGVAFQIDIEDAVGLQAQIEKISTEIEEKI